MPRTTLNIPQAMLDVIDKQANEDFSNRSGALAKLWRDKWSVSTSTDISKHQPASTDVECTSPPIDQDSCAFRKGSIKEENKKEDPEKKKKTNPRLAPLEVSEKIIGYLAERTGVKMRPEADGHRRHIQMRLNKGATVEQMLEVIRKKADEWVGTDMARHLVPKTLFCDNNFDGYLDQPEAEPRRGNHAGSQREAKFESRKDKSHYRTKQESKPSKNEEIPF